MPVWDSLVVGGPPIADQFWSEVFYQDATDWISKIGTSSAQSSTDGVWKSGLYSDAINQSTMDYGYRSIINNEQQMYHNPHFPHPSGWSPYSISGNALRITSTAVNQANAAEVAWAVRKAEHLNPDGSRATWDDFGAYAGGVPPAAWSPRGSYAAGQVVLFDDYPMLYKSGFISTTGRVVLPTFLDVEFRAKMPYGAYGGSADIQQRRATFPAMWMLQAILYGRGLNGQVSATTVTPFTNTGKLREPDVAEGFGESTTRIHQTAHYRARRTDNTYPFENADLQLKPVTQPMLTVPMDSAFHNYRLQLTAGKLAWFIDGVCTYVVATPADYYEPLKVYDTSNEFTVIRDGSGRGRWSGVNQKNPDGSDKYVPWSIMINLAEGGKWPRDYAKQLVDGGTVLPAHSETNVMDIEYVRAKVLREDNPDTYSLRDVVSTEPYVPPSSAASLNPRLVIHTQPAMREGRPVQQIVAVPRDGYDPTGKTFTWSSNIPELTFLQQGTLFTTPSIQGLTAGQLATITIDDGEE